MHSPSLGAASHLRPGTSLSMHDSALYVDVDLDVAHLAHIDYQTLTYEDVRRLQDAFVRCGLAENYAIWDTTTTWGTAPLLSIAPFLPPLPMNGESGWSSYSRGEDFMQDRTFLSPSATSQFVSQPCTQQHTVQNQHQKQQRQHQEGRRSNTPLSMMDEDATTCTAVTSTSFISTSRLTGEVFGKVSKAQQTEGVESRGVSVSEAITVANTSMRAHTPPRESVSQRTFEMRRPKQQQHIAYAYIEEEEMQHIPLDASSSHVDCQEALHTTTTGESPVVSPIFKMPLHSAATGAATRAQLSRTELSASDVSSWSLADFDIGRTLHRGRLGKLYLVRARTTRTVLVLKCLDKGALGNSGKARHTRSLRRHICLYEHAGARHVNILRLLTHFADSERYYLVLEHAEGGSLDKMLNSRADHSLSEKELRPIALQLATALAHLHSHGIVHRAVKPSNVLFKHGVVKLADFSAAVHLTEQALTSASSVSALFDPVVLVPPPATGRHYSVDATDALDYCAPEQIQHVGGAGGVEEGAAATAGPGRNGDGNACKVDMWALGVLCYEALCGYLPYEHVSPAVTRELIANGAVYYPEWLSQSAKDFLALLLRVKEAERASADEILTHPFLAQKATPPPPAPTASSSLPAGDAASLHARILPGVRHNVSPLSMNLEPNMLVPTIDYCPPHGEEDQPLAHQLYGSHHSPSVSALSSYSHYTSHDMSLFTAPLVASGVGASDHRLDCGTHSGIVTLCEPLGMNGGSPHAHSSASGHQCHGGSRQLAGSASTHRSGFRSQSVSEVSVSSMSLTYIPSSGPNAFDQSTAQQHQEHYSCPLQAPTTVSSSTANVTSLSVASYYSAGSTATSATSRSPLPSPSPHPQPISYSFPTTEGALKGQESSHATTTATNGTPSESSDINSSRRATCRERGAHIMAEPKTYQSRSRTYFSHNTPGISRSRPTATSSSDAEVDRCDSVDAYSGENFIHHHQQRRQQRGQKRHDRDADDQVFEGYSSYQQCGGGRGRSVCSGSDNDNDESNSSVFSSSDGCAQRLIFDSPSTPSDRVRPARSGSHSPSIVEPPIVRAQR